MKTLVEIKSVATRPATTPKGAKIAIGRAINQAVNTLVEDGLVVNGDAISNLKSSIFKKIDDTETSINEAVELADRVQLSVSFEAWGVTSLGDYTHYNIYTSAEEKDTTTDYDLGKKEHTLKGEILSKVVSLYERGLISEKDKSKLLKEALRLARTEKWEVIEGMDSGTISLKTYDVEIEFYFTKCENGTLFKIETVMEIALASILNSSSIDLSVSDLVWLITELEDSREVAFDTFREKDEEAIIECLDELKESLEKRGALSTAWNIYKDTSFGGYAYRSVINNMALSVYFGKNIIKISVIREER